MGHKKPASELRTQVRDVLMRKWDPFGVSDVPEAADEYDSYIGDVCVLLRRKASDKEIAGYLQKIETERMGLTDAQGNPLVPRETRAAAVVALQQLRSAEKVISQGGPQHSYRNWKLFSKYISPAFAKTQERRKNGVCIGCGFNPCRCKNRRGPRD